MNYDLLAIASGHPAILGFTITHQSFTWLMILAGVGFLAVLYVYGVFLRDREHGERKNFSRDRKLVYQSLDAIEYLAQIKSNYAGYTLASVKSHSQEPGTGSLKVSIKPVSALADAASAENDDDKTLAELLTRYMKFIGAEDPPKKKVDKRGLPQPDSSNLLLIHSYLADVLSRHDATEVTIDTAKEAISERMMRFGANRYVLGAIYFLLMAVLIHSYVVRLDSDAQDLRDSYSTYNALFHRTSQGLSSDSAKTALRDTASRTRTGKMRSPMISNGLANHTPSISDTSNKPHFWRGQNFAFRRDSITLMAEELRSKLETFDTMLQYYPFFVHLESAEVPHDLTWDSTLVRQRRLLSSGNYLIYAEVSVARNLKNFILPMLYGLIGAYLFVIRKLSSDIKNFDYTWKRSIRNEARLLLGLFVGAFFGYLYKNASLEGMAGVTTYILAFIGGYHVEILFSVMDKAVATFTTPPKDLPKGT